MTYIDLKVNCTFLIICVNPTRKLKLSLFKIGLKNVSKQIKKQMHEIMAVDPKYSRYPT